MYRSCQVYISQSTDIGSTLPPYYLQYWELADSFQCKTFQPPTFSPVLGKQFLISFIWVRDRIQHAEALDKWIWFIFTVRVGSQSNRIILVCLSICQLALSWLYHLMHCSLKRGSSVYVSICHSEKLLTNNHFVRSWQKDYALSDAGGASTPGHFPFS